MFQRGTLRIIESYQDFTCDETIEEEEKILSDDVMQAIKNKEAIPAADASCKGECMAGA